MKTLLQKYIVVIICFMYLHSNAQNKQTDSLTTRKNIIKFNVLGFVGGGNFTFGYEKVSSKKITINVMLGYINSIRNTPSKTFQSLPFVYDGTEFTEHLQGYILIPEIRYYFKSNKNKIPQGYYIASHIRYKNLKHDFEDKILYQKNNFLGPPSGDTVNCSHRGISSELSTGLTFGFQSISKKGLAFEWFIGPQFKQIVINRIYSNSDASDALLIGKFEYRSEYIMQNVKQFGIRAGMTIGYAF